MGRRIFTLTVAVVVGLFAVAMTATADDRPMTIEELYVEEDEPRVEEDEPGITMLRAQALSAQRVHKELAIEMLTRLVEDGRIGPDDSGYIAVLRLLATDGSSNQVRSGGGRVVYTNPDVRRGAVALLGEIGGPQARDVLREVLRHEREPMVLSQAMHAIGKVGLDGRTDIPRDIARVILRANVQDNPDLNLVFTTLRTLENMAAEGTEGLADSILIENVVQVVSGRYNNIVRNQAISTLNTFADITDPAIGSLGQR